MDVSLSQQAKDFRPGVYRHYKGDFYFAFFVGRLSEERNQELVVYQSLSKGFVWLRPLEMFLEEVEVDGRKVPRFMWIGEKINSEK